MGTFTAATAIPTGGLITSAWMTNTVADLNFLGAAGGTTVAKDLAFLRRTTTQAVSGLTIISFDAEDIDAANGHSTTTNTSRYTAVAAGKYRLSGACAVSWTGSASPEIDIAFMKNGTTITGSLAKNYPYNTTNATVIAPTMYVSLAVGDYVSMYVATVGALTSPNVDPSLGAVQMGIEWVGV